MDQKKIVFVVVLVAAMMSCSTLEYSPNQKFDRNSPVDLNAVNIKRLLAAPKDDTITIVLAGDCQRFYNELDKFVDKVNSIPSTDMVLLTGDISDFGLLQEFEWVYRSLSKLDKPVITVIGNHDTMANGESVYERMFGPLNSSFIYSGVKFILHNTNSLEYPGTSVPDLAWLENELQHSDHDAEPVENFIAVSHVPPFGKGGDFNPDLEEGYASLFSHTPGFLLSLHGHVHSENDYYPYNDGVRYMTSTAFKYRRFILLKIINGNVFKQHVQY